MPAPSKISAVKPAREEHIPLAIFYMVASGVVFTASSAASKWLIAIYPIGEVLFVRTAVALLTVAAIVLPTIGFAVYRTTRLGAHAMRASSQFFSQTMLLVAFSLMPLAGATAIMFSSPIFATLASAYFLHEKVGAARWSVLFIGFLGVWSSRVRARTRSRSARCSRSAMRCCSAPWSPACAA